MQAGASFDQVLEGARAHEQARLWRYRRWWIAQQIAVIVVSGAVLAACLPAMSRSEGDLPTWSLVASFFLGGWLGLIAMVGLVGTALLATAFALARIASVLRADDLDAFERTHRPWWVDAHR
jgi:hypothetical protein